MDRLAEVGDGGIERLDDCFGDTRQAGVEHERFLKMRVSRGRESVKWREVRGSERDPPCES